VMHLCHHGWAWRRARHGWRGPWRTGLPRASGLAVRCVGWPRHMASARRHASAWCGPHGNCSGGPSSRAPSRNREPGGGPLRRSTHLAVRAWPRWRPVRAGPASAPHTSGALLLGLGLRCVMISREEKTVSSSQEQAASGNTLPAPVPGIPSSSLLGWSRVIVSVFRTSLTTSYLLKAGKWRHCAMRTRRPSTWAQPSVWPPQSNAIPGVHMSGACRRPRQR
jgi:hypothetical protein